MNPHNRTVFAIGLMLLGSIDFCVADGQEDCASTLLRVEQWFSEIHRAPIVTLDPTMLSNENLPFIPHKGPGRFDSALAMNVKFEPVSKLREQMTRILGTPMDFFKGWNPKGEAHVTVVTPVEYYDSLRENLSIEEIDAIARDNRIQEAQLGIVGLGCGRALIDGKMEETHFIIVSSNDLVRIRQKISEAFLRKGGAPGRWDPRHFYPHVTIGYTRRDLHEADGVIKDLFHSLDSRFNLSVRPR